MRQTRDIDRGRGGRENSERKKKIVECNMRERSNGLALGKLCVRQKKDSFCVEM